MSENPTRILVVRLSAVGDVLRVLPALQVLKKNFPASYLGWVVEEPSRDILEAHPDIDEVFIFPKQDLLKKLKSRSDFMAGIKDFFSFIQRIRKKRFDLVIDFHGLFKSGILAWCSGAPARVGFTRPFTKELNFLFNNRRYPLDSHHISRIDRNLTLLKKMGLNTDHKPPVIHVPDRDRSAVQAFFRQQRIDHTRPLVAIHPGTSPTTPYKRWEPYRYAVVADQIIANNAAQVIFTWAQQELEMVKAIVSLMKYRGVIGPETQNLCQLAEIFKHCSLYLGSDTGPMHLAAFVGIPVVALFGPTDHIVNDPYVYTPHIIIRRETECSPCRKYDCKLRECMTGIKEESVIRAVNIMLGSVSSQKEQMPADT